MPYQSPFNCTHTEHDSVDPLCFSHAGAPHPMDELLVDYQLGVAAALDAGRPHVGFFLARHTAELCLKALLSKEGIEPPTSHNLENLLAMLPEHHDLRTATGSPQEEIRRYIEDLHKRDRGGDQARYATTGKGVLSLASLCCIGDRARLISCTDLICCYTLMQPWPVTA